MHIGSWGLPEFGVTEWLGREIAKLGGGYAPLTAQGGSSLVGPASEIQLAQNPYTGEVYPTTYQRVLGTSTNNTNQKQTTNNPNNGQQNTNLNDLINKGESEAERQAREAREGILSGIESAYSDYIRQLDEMAGFYGQREQEDVASAQQKGQLMEEELGTQKAGAEQQIDLYKQDVETRKRTSLEELAQNLRNLLKATQMRLGALGAGSSSASQVIAPWAIAKQGARAGAQVIGSANQQLADLDKKMIDVKTTYETQLSQIRRWVSDKIDQIRQTYDYYRAQLADLKRQAPIEKQNAINQLNQALLSNAISQINMYKQAALQYALTLDAWAKERSATLQEMKNQLAKTAEYQVQTPTYEPLKGIEQQYIASSGEFWNPALLRKQIREQLNLPA